MGERWSLPSGITPLGRKSPKVCWRDLKLGPGGVFQGKTQPTVGEEAQGWGAEGALSQPASHLCPSQCSSLWEV